MKRTLGTLGDVLFSVALVLVLIAALIYAGLQIYGVRFYEVESGSMAPAFAKGDVVGVREIAPHEVKQGDVIAFQREGFPDPIIHRVTRIRSNPDIRSILKDEDGEVIASSTTYAERTFWVQGDANPVEDPASVPGAALVGKQVMVVPWPFNLLVTQLSRQTLMVVGVASIAAFIAWEILEAAKELVQRRGRKTPTEIEAPVD